ncbi:hypothetical protein [Nocardia brasiliensis]|uniref:hypothetical protein n=1 Tax=Nocardia brasiliensis TaxID=37326 RepID=UPI002458F392|nr:hypothetical protein [Nocardia brasiliensis]
MDIIDVIVTFAKTGRIGALRLGLRGDELVAALREVGVPFRASDDFADFLQREESVEVYIEDGELRMLGLDQTGWREPEFRLPARMSTPGGIGAGSVQGTVGVGVVVLPMDRTLALLDEHECPWHQYPPLTFDTQTTIETSCGVQLTFALGETPGEYLLHCMYASMRDAGPQLDN